MSFFKSFLFLFLILPLFCLAQVKKEYYDDGKIKFKGKFKNGLKEGRHTLFCGDKRKIRTLITYKNDTLHGKYKERRCDYEVVVEKGRYKNGFRQGWFRYYDSEGYLEKKILFEKGQKVTEVQKEWDGLTIISCFLNDSLVQKDTLPKRNESLRVKTFKVWLYGMPGNNCTYFDPKTEKPVVIQKQVAGCVVSQGLVRRANRHNKKIYKYMYKKYGGNWRGKLPKECIHWW